MNELFAIRVKKYGRQAWVSSDSALATSYNPEDAFVFGWKRALHFKQLSRQHRGDELSSIEVVPFFAPDQPIVEPEPLRPSRKIMRCIYDGGHRHTSDCPMIVVEVDEDGNPVR
jgi:hypothetical protein